jgi:hypothetical protein
MMKTYTAYAAWRFRNTTQWVVTEEIDVEARSATEAENMAARILAKDYEPGGKIVEIVERQADYFLDL